MTDLGMLWESADDRGIYRAEVVRLGRRTAELRLIRLRDSVVVERKTVTLSYGAIFGPDVDDVREWNRIATAWSDKLDKLAKIEDMP